ncbi:FMN-dependent dehydrogenase-domain-containing protein [Xylaria sp. CBS 124048]|nr:FMN-dependent dehydrogenase-domain-containing protein [Xylaria sp. CBS 124048]
MPQDSTSLRSTSPCWIVLGNKVYDATPYLYERAEKSAALVERDGPEALHATDESRKIRLPGIPEYLPEEACLGTIDGPTRSSFLASIASKNAAPLSPEVVLANSEAPHISSIITLNDFEAAAKAVLPLDLWTYISSSAHDGSALRGNLASWEAIRFRPRILRNVEFLKPRTSILGSESAFPFFVSSMGQLGRGKPSGEIGAVRVLARCGIHGVLSAESTAEMEDIVAAFLEEKAKLSAARKESSRNNSAATALEPSPEAQLHYQLYIPADRMIGIQRIRRARATGVFRSLWLTVDAPQLGKRTAARKLQATVTLAKSPEEASQAGFGVGSHASSSSLNASLTWSDLKWIKDEWGGPIVLKGVQTMEDVLHAVDLGIDGVLLSNHGGRQMHDAVDALTVLLEIRAYRPTLLDRIEIFVDGGCRDGADVLKAVSLGAKAVGVGRPFFYAFAVYGEDGVQRCASILVDELHTAMKLLGIGSIEEARPEFVNTSRLLDGIWRPLDLDSHVHSPRQL